jgi:acetyl esterase/lipase
MPLHPQYEAMLAQLASAGGPALTDMPVSAGREMYRMMQPVATDIEVGKVENRTVSGPGGAIPVRIYTPKGTGPFPIFMNFHGGGWVIGDLDTADSQCRDVCNLAQCVVVSVDYRLAPEHRFPAAAEDCYAATAWAAREAKALNGDANRLAVGGDSAGGNLAAVVSLMARDRNGPKLVFQLLVYPVTDARFDTPSYRTNADGYLLTRTAMEWFWNHYAPTEKDRTNPYAAPLAAKDLTKLPPAMVLTAEFDPLRDEGEAYAKRLKEAGVRTEMIRYDGLIHGFFAMTRAVPAGRPGMEKACEALRRAFA